jgi:hypothetical protein
MTGNVLQGHAGGRELSTTQAQVRFIVLQARRQRFSNATTLCNDFKNATGVRVSTQTVKNRLHDAGLRSHRPAIRIPLTQRIFKRVCNGRRLMSHGQLMTPVLFTDESRFCVDFTDRQARVWRSLNERLAPACMQNTTVLAGFQSWCEREYALRGKPIYTSLETVH